MARTEGSVRRYYLAALAARTAAFLALVIYAMLDPAGFEDSLSLPWRWTPVTVAWLALMASMLLRLFPSRWESIGSQKLFQGRFRPTGKPLPKEEAREADRGAWKVLLLWAAVNALFLLGQARGWIGRRFLVCLAGFYGVCDIVCILFYCPFQMWLMHNRCCTVCRIFDWDYLMICTPLLRMGGPLCVSACVLAAVIFLRWEFLCHWRAERFFQTANQALQCRECQEHLCRYKRALSRVAPCMPKEREKERCP